MNKQNKQAALSINSAQFAQGQLENMVRQYGILTTITLLANAIKEEFGQSNQICVALPNEMIDFKAESK